jgi:hypothetical protein
MLSPSERLISFDIFERERLNTLMTSCVRRKPECLQTTA